MGDEHSLQAQWFHPDELGTLNVRAPVVLELIEMYRLRVCGGDLSPEFARCFDPYYNATQSSSSLLQS